MEIDEVKEKALKDKKQQLLAMMLRKEQEREAQILPRLSGISGPGTVASFPQQRLWFIDQYEPGNPLYNISVGVKIKGALDDEALANSLQSIVDRHESLRTRFDFVDGKVTQYVEDALPINVESEDLIALDEEAQTTVINRVAEEEGNYCFKLTELPLLRVKQLKLKDNEQIIFVTMHHIISDGWSMQIFVQELAAYYESYTNSRSVSVIDQLPKLSIQYPDYAHWQQQTLTGITLKKLTNYWKNQLSGEVPTLNLPTDRPRQSILTHNGSTYSFFVEPNVVDKLKNIAMSENATIFMVALAAFKIILYRYTGQSDLWVGTPIAGRNRQEIESLIGFFTNTLVIRSIINPEQGFRELLRELKTNTLDAYTHQDMPFEKLVEALQPERNQSHSPLFQAMFVMQNTGNASLKLGDTSIEFIETEHSTAKFDINVAVQESEGGLAGSIEFNSDLFDEATIERLASHYIKLLGEIAEAPETRIIDLPYVTDEEISQISSWQSPEVVTSTSKTIHELFERQVEQYPDLVAVSFEDADLTYQELNSRANSLAHYLLEKGVSKGTNVCLMLERSFDMIVCIMGVLKAGGVYVPVDPNVPIERSQFILNDIQAPLVLCHSEMKERLSDLDTPLVCVDQEYQTISNYSNENPKASVTEEDLAYIIFTSGSTGRPKGVSICHRNVLRLFDATKEFEFGASDVWTLFHSYAFDFSVWEIFGALLNGGKLVVVPQLLTKSPSQFRELLFKQGVTVLNQTPSAFKQLIEEEKRLVDDSQANESTNRLNLKYVIFGGDKLSPPDLQTWIDIYGDDQPQLINMYGITETTVHVTIKRITKTEALAPTSNIGKPIDDLVVYILDEQLRQVPIGVPGEMYIAGGGVAKGYFQRKELTDSRFISNPYSDIQEKLYKSGDLGRYLSNGEIEYLGRIDSQVKVRGFRIELGEIEAALASHESVKSAVVIAETGSAGTKNIVAYYVLDDTADENGDASKNSQNNVTISDLRNYLAQKVPEYMIPAHFVSIEEVPLNANGKIEYRQLPEPDEERQYVSSYVPPSTDAETLLCDVWRDVLQLDSIGVEDNFFELGGDSILTLQVIARAKEVGLAFTPKQLFSCQTIKTLAKVAQNSKNIVAEQGPIEGDAQLTPIQHWYFEQEIPNVNHWNQATTLSVSTRLNRDYLRQAIMALVHHHDALRMQYSNNVLEGISVWQQQSTPISETNVLFCYDWSSKSEKFRNKNISKVAGELQRSLDLNDSIFKVAYFDFGDDTDGYLLLIAHHLVVDGVSWRIIFADLQQAYDQLCRNEDIKLPAKTTSFQYWAKRLTDHANSDEIKSEYYYWRDRLNKNYPSIPIDKPRGKNNEKDAKTCIVKLKEEDTQKLLQEVPSVFRTQINDILLTALTRVITGWTGGNGWMVSLEGHGREDLFDDVDLSRTVGWFTCIYPVSLHLSTKLSRSDDIKSIKEQLRAVNNNGIGYGLLRYLQDIQTTDAEAAKNDTLDLSPLKVEPQISFNYLGQFDQVLSSDDVMRLCEDQSIGGHAHDPNAIRRHVIDVFALINGGQLQLGWVYNGKLHRPATIEPLVNNWLAELKGLIDHCLNESEGGVTPSDYPLVKVSQAQLDHHFDLKTIDDIYGLSPLQQGMLFHSVVTPHNGIYVEQVSCVLSGNLNVNTFSAAWNHVVNKHDALKSSFVWEGVEAPFQMIHKRAEVHFEVIDLSALSELEQNTEIDTYISSDRERGFALDKAPLMRFYIAKIASDEYRFIWSHHHLLLDGWSIPIIFSDVLASYEQLAAQNNISVDTQNSDIVDLTTSLGVEQSPYRYRDYIQWYQSQDINKCEGFWRNYLSGFYTPTRIAVGDRAPTEAGMDDFEEHIHVVEGPIYSKLTSFGRKHQLTVNSIMQAAWSLLISRYSGEKDVIFGAVGSGRPADLEGVESIVGMFINTLPIRVKLTDQAVLSWLNSLQSDQVEARQFEYAPLARIQSWSEVASGNPLFESLLVYENYPVSNSARDNDKEGIVINDVIAFEQTNYPITLVMVPTQDSLRLRFMYDKRCYENDTIMRMAGHIETLLDGILKSPQGKLSELPILTEQEATIRQEWNATEWETPEYLLHELVTSKLGEHADREAVITSNKRMTYGELDQRSTLLANQLIEDGLTANQLVAVVMKKGWEQVVAVLAILRAGGAYVPVDAGLPQERIDYLLDRCEVKQVFTQSSIDSQIKWPECKRYIVDTVNLSDVDESDLSRPISEISTKPDDIAYVIFTSGSTGQPKGVVIDHRGAVNTCLDINDQFSVNKNDRILGVSSLSFDLSVYDIFGLLAVGGALVLPDADQIHNPNHWVDLCIREKVTIWDTVPALLQLALNELDSLKNSGINTGELSLRQALLSGDWIPLTLPELASKTVPNLKLCSLGGATEASIWSIHFTINEMKPTWKSIPYGYPLRNQQFHVLDENLDPCPVLVKGELYIGGIGLAKGYWRDQERTDNSFIVHPRTGERLYRTGDLGRYMSEPEGAIEYMGRADFQVKIRGFRVELGEIEAAMNSHSAIVTSVVIAWKDNSVNRLVAYYVENEPVEQSEIRAYLKAKVPEYMVPAYFIKLETLPLSSNGKVDRKQLPEPEANQAVSSNTFVAPRNETEAELVEIWKTIFSVEKIGIDDNFFELGGDSILGIQIVTRSREQNINLNPRQIFEYQTVRELAKAAENTKVIIADQEVSDSPFDLTPVQRWFFEQEIENRNHWNQATLLDVNEELKESVLVDAVKAVVKHHDVFRLRFGRKTNALGDWVQHYGAVDDNVDLLQVFDWSKNPESKNRKLLEVETDKLQRSLSLSDGPLLRVAYFNYGSASSGRLLIIAHHTVIDGVSWRIMLEDLQIAYKQLVNQSPVTFPQKTTSYELWSKRIHEYSNDTNVLADLAYWVDNLQQGVNNITPDFNTGQNTEEESVTYTSEVNMDITYKLLHEAPSAYRTQINDILLTSLSRAMKKWNGNTSLLLNLETHGRDHEFDDIDLSRTIGWFTNIFPLRLQNSGGSMEEDILSTQRQLNEITNSGISYGLLRYLSESLSEQAKDALVVQPQVSFNYLGRFDNVLSEDSLFGPSKDSSGRAQGESNKRLHMIDIICFVQDAKLKTNWIYSKSLFKSRTISKLANAFNESISQAVKHCSSVVLNGLTTDANTANEKTTTENNLSESDAQSILIKFNESGDKPPIFCVHSATGLASNYTALASVLEKERPFYGIQSLGFEEGQIPFSSVESMASAYISAIRSVKPEGPYVIAGWSLGALVAFEVAQQLKEKGHTIDKLILIDDGPELPANTPKNLDEPEILRQILISQGIKINKHIFKYMNQDKLFQRILNHMKEMTGFSHLNDREMLESFKRMIQVTRLNVVARKSYQTKNYDGDVLLIKAETPQDDEQRSEDYGWGQYISGSFKVNVVAGDHLGMLNVPNVSELARSFKLS